MNAKTLVTAATLAAALIAGYAQAAAPHLGTASAANAAGPDLFTDGARGDVRDPFTDGARGNVDPYTDGAHIAGMDRRGPSSDPARQRDTFTDGARGVDPYTDGARIAGMDRRGVSAPPAHAPDQGSDPYTRGGRSVQPDPFTDGARA
jgi:hypothetical protein